MPGDTTTPQDRILLLAPTPGDAALTCSLLAEAQLSCQVCRDEVELSREIDAGAAVILVTEDVLAHDMQALGEALERQPTWSDVPILLLSTAGADSSAAAWAMQRLGNVTVLERPVRVTTLVSTLRAAIRARRRQYELRDQLIELKHAEATLRTQSERQRLLWEAAAVLLTTSDPVAMMNGVFAKIAPHFQLDAYLNFMVDDSGDALHLASCSGIPEKELHNLQRLEFGQAICGTVAQEKRPLTATFIQDSDEPVVQVAKSYGMRAFACTPLMAEGRLLGTLSFASCQRNEFQADEIEFMRTICYYVTIAHQRMRLVEELRESDRRKDEFLATLAHELRNPLAPIRTGLQVIRLSGDDSDSATETLDMMERQLHQLVRLIDDLLDVSRITRGRVQLRLEPCELGTILSDAIESSRPMIAEAGVELTVSLPRHPVELEADSARLSQVFSNLLTNAAKYTERGGRVWLTGERHGSDVVVKVRDTGIGIPRDMLAHVFDMFTQVDGSLERSHGGLGIGLSLVRALVELHEGSVSAHSDGLGQGSEFEVRLPLSVRRHAPQHTRRAEPAVPPAPLATAPHRILVVDDNEDAAHVLAMMLRIMGHDTRTAHDGLAAVEQAESFRPRLVLLDLGMPRLNGYDAARQIRQQPWGEEMTLVALTGWGQEDDRRRVQEAGFNHHLVKPADTAALQALLKQLDAHAPI